MFKGTMMKLTRYNTRWNHKEPLKFEEELSGGYEDLDQA